MNTEKEKSKRNRVTIPVLSIFAFAIIVAVVLGIGYTYKTQPASEQSSDVYQNSYYAYVDDVFAGNKMLVDVNLGFGVELNNTPVQINGVRTEPLKSDKGDRAKRFTESQVEEQNVLMRVYQQSDSGRWLVDIIYDDQKKDLGKELIETGYGKPE